MYRNPSGRDAREVIRKTWARSVSIISSLPMPESSDQCLAGRNSNPVPSRRAEGDVQDGRGQSVIRNTGRLPLGSAGTATIFQAHFPSSLLSSEIKKSTHYD